MAWIARPDEPERRAAAGEHLEPLLNIGRPLVMPPGGWPEGEQRCQLTWGAGQPDILTLLFPPPLCCVHFLLVLEPGEGDIHISPSLAMLLKLLRARGYQPQQHQPQQLEAALRVLLQELQPRGLQEPLTVTGLLKLLRVGLVGDREQYYSTVEALCRRYSSPDYQAQLSKGGYCRRCNLACASSTQENTCCICAGALCPSCWQQQQDVEPEDKLLQPLMGGASPATSARRT
jgi:hypothetical protein